MCAQIAFRESDGSYKVFQALELERCELKMLPHNLYHLLVLRTRLCRLDGNRTAVRIALYI